MTNKNLVLQWPYKSQQISPDQHWTPRCTQNTCNHWGSPPLEIHRRCRVLNMMNFCRHRMWRWGHRIPLNIKKTLQISQSFAYTQNHIERVYSVLCMAWLATFKGLKRCYMFSTTLCFAMKRHQKINFFIPTSGISSLPSGTKCRVRIFFLE